MCAIKHIHQWVRDEKIETIIGIQFFIYKIQMMNLLRHGTILIFMRINC